MKKKKNTLGYRSTRFTYYGPHPCQKCGVVIVKSEKFAPVGFEFNFVHDSHYPNHKWIKHKCQK